MKRSLYNAWLKALETAPKTRYLLKDSKGMCCLGVLCTLIPDIKLSKKRLARSPTWFKYKKDKSCASIPNELSKELGISKTGQRIDGGRYRSLTYINDNSDTFAPVIQALRDHPEAYFEIEED